MVNVYYSFGYYLKKNLERLMDKERLIMKKNILSYMILLFGIAIISTGCIKADSTITFDNHDNMKVETTVLFPQELMTYSDNSTSNDDFSKDTETLIGGIKVETEVQKVDSRDGVGNKRIEICKNISRAKKVEQVGFITAKNSDIGVLTIKNYLLFKKYILSGQIMKPEDVKSYDSNMNPNSLVSSKIRIQVPSQAKGVKANTNTKDLDNSNIYVWKIDYTSVNPIDIEFCMLNWYAIIGTVIVLVLLIFYVLNSGKRQIVFSAFWIKIKEIFAQSSPQKVQITTEPKNVTQSKQSKNHIRFIVITLILLIVLGVSIFFSLPKICNILVDNSIKSVYVGETAKAVQMIEIANILNLDKNTDLSKEIFVKGLNEIENNDTKTAKVLFDLVAKTKTQNNKKYSTELTNKALKALKQNQLSKCKYLTEAAVRFDIEIPKTMATELAKKQYDLAFKKKYQETLIISEILIMLEPKNAENHLRYGASLALLGKYKESIAAYTEAIKLKKELGSAYLNRGLIYFNKLSEYDKAMEDFNQVIRFSFDKKQMAIARLNMAKIFLKKKDYRKAMDEAWTAKDLYYALGNLEMADESYRLFEYVAQLECDRPNGYCY